MLRKSTALVITFAIASAALQGTERIPRPNVPTTIEVGTEYKLVLRGHAIGTQNYICAPATTASGVDWFFIGPQATLFDDDGRQITTHFQSMNPFKNAIHATWQHSGDTSAVWATKLSGSTDPAYVAPDAIEWLLLEAKGQVGPAGGVKLAAVKRIQRINTAGGLKPPSAECTPSTINSRRLVPYEADYYFYE